MAHVLAPSDNSSLPIAMSSVATISDMPSVDASKVVADQYARACEITQRGADLTKKRKVFDDKSASVIKERENEDEGRKKRHAAALAELVAKHQEELAEVEAFRTKENEARSRQETALAAEEEACNKELSSCSALFANIAERCAKAQLTMAEGSPDSLAAPPVLARVVRPSLQMGGINGARPPAVSLPRSPIEASPVDSRASDRPASKRPKVSKSSGLLRELNGLRCDPTFGPRLAWTEPLGLTRSNHVSANAAASDAAARATAAAGLSALHNASNPSPPMPSPIEPDAAAPPAAAEAPPAAAEAPPAAAEAPPAAVEADAAAVTEPESDDESPARPSAGNASDFEEDDTPLSARLDDNKAYAEQVKQDSLFFAIHALVQKVLTIGNHRFSAYAHLIDAVDESTYPDYASTLAAENLKPLSLMEFAFEARDQQGLGKLTEEWIEEQITRIYKAAVCYNKNKPENEVVIQQAEHLLHRGLPQILERGRAAKKAARRPAGASRSGARRSAGPSSATA